jgi:hypothetical protein
MSQIKLNEDGELEVVQNEDFTPNAHYATASIDDLTATAVQRLAYQQSQQEYKLRVARNGMCPHDCKPCWKYKVCILAKADACEYYQVTKNSGSRPVGCNTCRNAPKTGSLEQCPLFLCMITGTKRQ